MTENSLSPQLRSLCDRYVEAQLQGDRRTALRVLQSHSENQETHVFDVHRVICEAQRAIGALWQENKISIAQEHVATAISQIAISQLYQIAEPLPPNGRLIVIACVEGEIHDFPARLLADQLELAGFAVRFLGANVPTESLLAFLADSRLPDLLALSITMTFNIPALRDAMERLRSRWANKLHIAIGGGACQWSAGLAEQLGADITASSAEELIEQINVLPRATS